MQTQGKLRVRVGYFESGIRRPPAIGSEGSSSSFVSTKFYICVLNWSVHHSSESASLQSCLTLEGSNRGRNFILLLDGRIPSMSESRELEEFLLVGLGFTVELLDFAKEKRTVGTTVVSFSSRTLAKCVLIISMKHERLAENCSSW
jgi:hypothetical protein